MKSKDIMQTRQTQGLNVKDKIDPLTNYLDGMGTATARIIINKHLDDGQLEKFGLKDLKNTGRYYFVKVVDAEGKSFDEVLIDKQTGRIQSLRGKTG